MPVRGKILNCLKADYGKIFKSEIITDLLKVMGCGVEVNDKHNKDLSLFNLANLRWNKIVICTDADVDGYQIRTLILTMLWRLTPTLIQEGYVYIAESLCMRSTPGKNLVCLFREGKRRRFSPSSTGKSPSSSAPRAWARTTREMMWMTTMNPDTRRLIRVMPAEAEATAQVFDLLLGRMPRGGRSTLRKTAINIWTWRTFPDRRAAPG